MYRIEITLDEPLTAGYGIGFSNEIRSLDYIPATMLRGALYEELVLQGRENEAESWFGPGRFWTSAWPANCLPMPLAFSQVKRDDGLGGVHGLRNELSFETDTNPPESGQPQAWQRARSRWMQLDASLMPVKQTQKAARRIDMHAGLRYDTQSVRGAAFFSRQAIEQGTTFHAFVSEIPEGPVEAAVLGKRRSVSGRVTLAWEHNRSDLFDLKDSDSKDSKDTFLYLATDALVPGAQGGWLRGFERDSIKYLSGAEAEVWAASSFTSVGGWCGPWKLPREQCIAISAGSCWRLRTTGSEDSDRLRNWLDHIVQNGLGLRCHEGFGRVCVNPPWLVNTANGESFGQNPATGVVTYPNLRGGMNYHPLPGTPDNADICETARSLASKLKALPSSSAALHDLLAVAQRGENAAAFMERRAGVNAGQKKQGNETWQKINRELAAPLQSLDPAHHAFLIMAVQTWVEANA